MLDGHPLPHFSLFPSAASTSPLPFCRAPPFLQPFLLCPFFARSCKNARSLVRSLSVHAVCPAGTFAAVPTVCLAGILASVCAVCPAGIVRAVPTSCPAGTFASDKLKSIRVLSSGTLKSIRVLSFGCLCFVSVFYEHERKVVAVCVLS